MATFGNETDDLRRAVAALADERRATYYDEAIDAEARSAYYATIDRAASGADLFAALSGLVASTHLRPHDYKPALHLYPSVDLQPNGQLRSIYTGEERDPEAFIHEDAQVEQARAQAFRDRLSMPGMASDQDRGTIEAQIEAELPFNCEHVVPQAWFAKREPMRGDLHHLFFCEKECNNFRAAIPFFDFADFRDVVREHCGKAGPQGFEPHEGKGAVARATFYFLLRYPGQISRSPPELEESRLETLRRWHEEFGVTLYERHRNARIAAKQGNRNPFVDEPALAARVELHLGLG